MRSVIFVMILSCLLGCSFEGKSQKIQPEVEFFKNYTAITYYKSNLDLSAGEYLVTNGDSLLSSNLLSEGIILSPRLSLSLLDFMRSSQNFEEYGSNCGTYFDLSCFLFSRSDTIIGVVAVGCSFGSVRLVPSERGIVDLTRQGAEQLDSILSELERKF